MGVRPILFSGPMVRALLNDLKTNTRRVLTRLGGFGTVTDFGRSDTPGYDWHFRDREKRWHDLRHDELLSALEYQMGDLVWVKEGYRASYLHDDRKPSEIPVGEMVQYEASGPTFDEGLSGKRRPSIFMCQWMSRLTLKVTDVRVQHLQAINEVDAKAEGATIEAGEEACGEGYRDAYWFNHGQEHGTSFYTATESFRDLWDSLNAKRGFGWAANPWVVAISFEVIRQNVATLTEGGE